MKCKLLVAIVMLCGHVSCAQASDISREERPSSVISPIVPKLIDIAGDKLDVNRFDIRERLDRELIAFSYMHSSTLLIIKRANRLFPEVEPILKEMGVPDDFKYLMAVESNLMQTAVSPVGAAGLWQIMPATARELGLEVNKDIDERYNIEKATRAACEYLLQAYNKYGNWWSVAASYNAGQGRITGELRKQKMDNAVDLYLNHETSRYFFRIAALKVIMAQPSQYGFILESKDLYPPYKYKEISIDTTIVSLVDWALAQGTTLAYLKEANLWLRNRNLPDESRKKYVIRVLTDDFIYYKPEKTVAHDKNWCTK